MTEIQQAYDAARRALLAERTADGHWTGYLSSSALSTATAVSALCAASPERHSELVASGARWLIEHQNADGGWGDTTDSPSNIATTLLCRAALEITREVVDSSVACFDAEVYLNNVAGPLPRQRAEAIRAAYGHDRTFSTPIMANLAIAGLVDWSDVPALPFELARLPRSWFRFARLHVVSYALPALIAIGQAIHAKHPSRCPVTRALRTASIAPTLKLLERIQPASGGYLEATPLTSFVVMSLAAAGRADHAVAVRGIDFLVASAREDGSWPIDTNLATWVTTQAIESLGDDLADLDRDAIRDWLLGQQHLGRHAYTDAAPGGWAWTDLSGGVPDADDTPGALIALARLEVPRDDPAIRAGVRWLLDLQNRDGGWPTFCRGWGRLPFDRSAPDLTAHAIRALTLCAPNDRRAQRAVVRGFDYLRRTQSPEGSWSPLWFGNQHAPALANPVYGTSRVLCAFADAAPADSPEAARAAAFLVAAQNADGGWGGASGVSGTIEETALAVRALAMRPADAPAQAAALRGGSFLAKRLAAKGLAQTAPIGLYFSLLWYSERMYPLIWSVGALGALLRNSTSETSR